MYVDLWLLAGPVMASLARVGPHPIHMSTDVPDLVGGHTEDWTPKLVVDRGMRDS